ncbi:CAS1 domain-containing protein [Thelonectria olida]|uniref:CAS1 domain-containing protein n=1 Tax=Thelonectria olida TaxID=1576542 RepID=A0A9P8W4D7_9HYPO|nr:CAS1 domain-containing protein [Thelonectria olida]
MAIASMPAFTTRILLTAWGVFLLAVVAFWTLFPGDDPYRCRALLETGQWVDPPAKNGTRMTFNDWKPDGCMLHKYSSIDVRQCLEGRRIVLSGDSLNRQVAYGLARILERDEAKWDQTFNPGHNDILMTYHGVSIINIWNPYLHSDDEPKMKTLTHQLELFRTEKEDPPASIEDQKGAAMILLGGGAWFAFGKDQAGMMNNYKTALDSLSDLLRYDMKDFYTAPMDPHDGVGNRAFFAPPNLPSYMGDDPIKAQNRSQARFHLGAYRNWIHRVNEQYNFPFAWSMPLVSDNDNMTIIDPTVTGFHVIDSVSEMKANIYLNLRCNAKLDRLKKWPYSRTCCTDYGGKPMIQQAFAGIGVAFLVVCLALEILDLLCRNSAPRFRLLNMQTGGAFVLPLLMSYYADRTQLMAKEVKVWSSSSFVLLCIPWIILAVLTISRSTSRRSSFDAATANTAQSFLSRDQTDEWKGWMQLTLLAYRWLAGHRSPAMAIFARVLTSAFVFQSGFGHATYFLNKKDYSFARVASVLLRLNLLTCALCYITNSDYSEYSFVILANFWFIVVWAILGFRHKRYNDDLQMVLAKIFLSAAIITFFFRYTPASQWTFALLNTCFNIRWNWATWENRLRNDLYITYAGMLAAIAKQRCTVSLNLPLRCSLGIISAMILGGFYSNWSEKKVTQDSYLPWHPFIAVAPVLAYLALRNVTQVLRNYHSAALTWAGRCSLELYVLQCHLLAAADTEGVLLTGIWKNDGSLATRWKDLLLIAPVFIWISGCASSATVDIVRMIVGQPSGATEELYIPLSNMEEKEDEGRDSIDDVRNEPATGLMTGLTANWSGSWVTRGQLPSAKSFLLSAVGRIFFLFIAIWALNLLSPSPSNIIPDGFTPHRVGLPPPPKSGH